MATGRAAEDEDPAAGGGDFQLSGHAYAALLQSIARCELAPGAWLNEREASAQLGMSRTPFREALHRLALEGLIHIVPRRGARVSLIDLDDIQDSLEVRRALETSLMRRVISDGLPIDLAALKKLLTTMRQVAKDGEAATFMDADEQFHLTIAAAARNRRAMEALTRAWVHVNRARYLQPPTPADMRASARQHAEILDALRVGDATKAEAAMVGHMQSAGDLFGELSRRHPEAFVPPREVALDGADLHL